MHQPRGPGLREGGAAFCLLLRKPSRTWDNLSDLHEVLGTPQSSSSSRRTLSRLVNVPTSQARSARIGTIWVGDAGDIVVDVNVGLE